MRRRSTDPGLLFCLTVSAACSVVSIGGCLSSAAEWPIGPQTENVFKTSDGGEVGYLVSVPDDESAAEDGKLPLMLFLHGRGESNGPLSLVAKWGPPRLIAKGESLPYIVVSPQCPTDDSWASETQQQRLVELLDEIIKQHPVDTDRVYLTGLSMGGFGSWRLATDHPDRFAAVVPVCGGGQPESAAKLVDIPIWVFHGDQDRAVPFKLSVQMVDAIRAAGGTKVRFTTLEHYGHNTWSPAYGTAELYQWISRHRLSDRE